MTRTLLSAAEVAAKLHKKREWFYKRLNRETLEALGFPPPVPGCGLVWDPAAIDAWLDAQMPDGLRPRSQKSEVGNQNGGPPESRDDLAARGQAIADSLDALRPTARNLTSDF
jgi:predicted DNA-binding transcriptional regulator AlpA